MDKLKGFFADLKSSVEKNNEATVDGVDSTLDLIVENGPLDHAPIVK